MLKANNSELNIFFNNLPFITGSVGVSSYVIEREIANLYINNIDKFMNKKFKW